MLVLAIDTSSAAVTAGVFAVSDRRVTVRAERTTLNARGHGEFLAPNIAACLAEAGGTPGDLAAVVVGLGPGPFTGLRVGLVTAAVMAQLLGIPAYGVCSLDAIGAAVQDDGDLLVATDARRREVYWARYDASRVRVDGPHVSRPGDVPTAGLRHMTGAGARSYQRELGLSLLDVDHPPAGALAGCALDRITSGAPSDPLTPLYLRRPDAVEPGASKAVSR